MPTLLAVARYGGFTAAARQLGMSASAVSQAVRAVETRVGAPLFHRTTRAVALTEAGQSFVARVAPAAAEIAAAIDGLRHPQDVISGRLRLNVPRVALPLAVQPVLGEVRRRYPDVIVEIAVDDASVDIVAAGFDAGVRVGSMIAGDMITVRLTPPFKAVVTGAPSYFQTHGRPRALADLADHDCIAYRQKTSGALYRWELIDASGREVEVDVRGGLVVDDALLARDAALDGLGLAYLFEPLVTPHAAAGRLEVVLPSAAIEEPGLFIYFPRRARDLPPLRAFIDCARRVLKRRSTLEGRRRSLDQ